MNLFSTPIQKKQVRKNVLAYKYPNGTINIDGYQYHGYSMTEAIKKYRTTY